MLRQQRLIAIVVIAIGLTALQPNADASPPNQLIPANKDIPASTIAQLRQRGGQPVFTTNRLLTVGMPVGGIAAGQLYLRGDGVFGDWQIDGRRLDTGSGDEAYEPHQPHRSIEQGVAIAVFNPDGQMIRALLDSYYDHIEFTPEYPRAQIRFRGEDRPGLPIPPVQVDLEVWTPFMPLQARGSAWPATVLDYTITNPTDQQLGISVGGWLQNNVFGDFVSPITLRRRNRVVSADTHTTVLLDATQQAPPPPAEPQRHMVDDFESGTYERWTVEGRAFGRAPAAGAHSCQQPVTGYTGKYLVNSYTNLDLPIGRMLSYPIYVDLPYLTFRIGGGYHPHRTCLNLLVNDRAVLTRTGLNSEHLDPHVWDLSDYIGQQVHLEIVDVQTSSWGHINVDDIALTNVVPAELVEYDLKAEDFGTMALTLVGEAEAEADAALSSVWDIVLQRADADWNEQAQARWSTPLVGGARTRFLLGPGQSRRVRFILSWDFPNLCTGHSRQYAEWFSDAADVARKLVPQLDRLHADTVRFCDAYYRDTTLPWWLNTRLLMPVANLATDTVQWWDNGRFWAWEGVGCCPGTCTHVWNYAQAHAWLFPSLARSVRTMQDLGEAFAETTGLVGFRSDKRFAADGQAGTILKCYREHLLSPDDQFLKHNWPRIKLALEYLISHDPDHNGIIEDDQQHNTYDINFVGPNTFVGALYLVALRAGEEMAREMNEPDNARRYHELFQAGRDWTVANLFNGDYFEQRLPPDASDRYQYVAGCLSDQLFGQTWAHMLGLGYLYPPETVKAALKSVYKYNWAPDVGPYSAEFPPERVFARPGEPGLLLCTWPRGNRPARPVRYANEVWTGIEYQVAAGLIWEGFVDEGLTIINGINQRYDPARRNPFNEVECGNHYARALASWSVRHALAGFSCNVPRGIIRCAPRFQEDDHKSFFAAGTGWGTLEQARQPGMQTNAIALVGGVLELRQFETELPPGARAGSVTVTLASTSPAAPATQVPATFTQDDQHCTVKLAAPVTLTADRRLCVRITY